ncbi:MAG: hypothetical protein RMJ37_05610 [Spirochaetia bacterium]|nr:hypothetical protein [Spirochaetota bacterium]MDW8112794.1 hypothetical protein [Spirochaetia bacterium]
MSLDSIQLSSIPSEDRDYIRKVSLKTLINFFSSEIIGFGFGVPVAVIIAIGYGNIADIFMDVYFLPVAVMTVVIVTFVAFPTNVFLVRHLIKFILKNDIESFKEFLFSTSKIPLYASINLFFRITIGGLIADIWGFVRHGDVSIQTFIALFISPTFGAWTASIVYFFVLQNILGDYNVKMSKYISIKSKSEIIKHGRLSIRFLYPTFITLTILMSSLIISSGSTLGAAAWGQVLIAIATITVLSLLFMTSHITLRKLFNSVNYVLENWSEVKQSSPSFGMYDIEDIIRNLHQLNQLSKYADETLKEIVKSTQNIPDKILSSLKIIENAINTIRTKQDIRIGLTSYQDVKKELSRTNTLVIEFSERSSDILSYLNSLKKRTSGDIQGFLSEIKSFPQVVGELKKIGSLISDMSRFLSVIEQNVSYMSGVSRDVVMSNFVKVEKYAKDMEMIFINFQLEMAKVGYPEEFRFISLGLSKLLNRMSEIARDVRNVSHEFETRIKELYDNIKTVFVMYDAEGLVISGLNEKTDVVWNHLKNFSEQTEKFSEDLEGVKLLDKPLVQRLVDGSNSLNVTLNKISLDRKRVEEVLDVCKSETIEVQKILASNIETVKTIKKLIQSAKVYEK